MCGATHRDATHRERSAVTARLDALRARLDGRLLITNLINIEYLTGFASSHAALLLEPGKQARLYTDFRYILDAEKVPGVKAELARRSLMLDLAERLDGSPGFEAGVLPPRPGRKAGPAGR